MDAAAARCLTAAASIVARVSAEVWASNAAVAEIAANANRMCTVLITIFLESKAFPADVIGEGRKAIRQWK